LIFLLILPLCSIYKHGGYDGWSAKIENYYQKHILKSGKKPVATKLYGNDAYMIHFQTYGC
jgi:hypothetical protein